MAKTSTPGTHKVKKSFLAVFMNLVLWIFSLSCIFPIVWMIYSSLKEKRAFNADIIGLPKSPTLVNYIRILSNPDYHLAQSMWNSLRTTVLSIILIIAFSFIVGYILARVRFKLNRVLVYYVPDGYADPDSLPSGSDLCRYSDAAEFQTTGLPCFCHTYPLDFQWASSWWRAS